jgi:hypothetical protein
MNCDIDFGTATFKGIEFEILPTNNTCGRRILTHEYPFTDFHYNEDLGAQTESWTVRGAFIGENWRDKLQVAKRLWSRKGSGVFYEPTENRSHPVTLVSKDFDFDNATLNRVEFTLEFVARGDDPYPSNSAVTLLARLNDNIDNFISILTESYANLMSDFNQFNDVLLGVEGALDWVGIVGRVNLGPESYVPTFSEINSASGSTVAQVNISTATGIYEAALDDDNQDFFAQSADLTFSGSSELESQGVLFAGLALAYYARTLEDGIDFGAARDFRETALQLKDSVESAGFSYADTVRLLCAIDGLISTLADATQDQCLDCLEGTHHALVASYELFGNIGQAERLMELSGGVSGAAIERLIKPCEIV